MLKEQQLAELADRSQRMRLKIGSYATDKPQIGSEKQQLFTNQEMSHMRQKRTEYRHKRTGSKHQKKASISPLRSKSPSIGGGMRAQRVRDKNIDQKIQNRLSREREKSSPLRMKTLNLRMDSRESQEISNSRSPVERFSYKSKAAQKAIDLTHAIKKARRSSPLRNRSPAADVSFSRYDAPVRESKPRHIKQTSSITQSQNDERLKARAEALDMDQSAIRRRLNLVRDELDHVYLEKEKKHQEFLLVADQTETLNIQINAETEMDINNARLNEEIAIAKQQGKSLHLQIDTHHQVNKDTDFQINKSISAVNQDDVVCQQIQSQIYSTDQGIETKDRENLALNRDIGLSNAEKENYIREESILNTELARLEIAFIKAKDEKNELHNQLEMLSGTYNDCRRVLGREQQDLERNSNWQTKLVVTQLLFNELSSIQERFIVKSFKDIQGYSNFDKNCFSKLKTFSGIIYRLGQHNKQVSLSRWYSNAFKPLDTRWQNYDLALKISKQKRLSRVFYTWKQIHEKKIGDYSSKTNSINQIWDKLALYSQCEIQRAMAIWKTATRQKKLKTTKIRNMILKRYRIQLTMAILSWKNFNMQVGQEVRIIMLQREYSQKFLLNRLFGELKQQTVMIKRARLITMGQCLKGWTSYIQYKRQLMHTNLQAIQLGRINRKYNLKAVFDAMVCHKESRKHKIMQAALRDDMDVALEEHKQFNQKAQDKMTTKSQMKSGSIVRDMIGKRLFAYFAHWKGHTDSFKAGMNGKIKDRIIRMHNSYVLSYFQNWKKNATQKKTRHKKKMIMQMEENSKEMENEAIGKDQKSKVKAEAVRSVHERKHTKMLSKFILRIQKNAVDRWRDKVSAHAVGKARSNQVLGRMRNRFQREAFNRFKKFHLDGKQGDRNEESLDHLKETLRLRTLRKHYYAFCAFTHHHKVAKKMWRRVFVDFDRQQKQSALKRWKENGHEKLMSEHQKKQNNTHDQIAEKNKLIGEHENSAKYGEKHSEDLQAKLIKKAHKQLGNYMQRYYSDTTSSTFKQWRAASKLDVHKAKMMRSMFNHMKKHAFTQFRNACKTHITKEKQKERRALIRSTVINCDEHQQSVVNNRDEMEVTRKNVKASQVRSFKKIQKKEDKREKVRAALTRRNMTLDFVSRKRKIFESWRFAVKQQRGFLLAVINVLEKSMTNKGFHYIKNTSIDNHVGIRKYKRINMQIMRFMKRNMGDYFNKWKNGALRKVDARFNEVKAVHEETEAAFADHVKRIKKQNCANILHHFQKSRLKLIFKGWKKQKNYWKKLHAQQRDVKDKLPLVFQKRAIQKWHFRVELTKKIRMANVTMKRNKAIRLKRMVFEGIIGRRGLTTHLMEALSNVVKLLTDKNKMDGFKTVKSYAISYHLTSTNGKAKAKLDIQSMLTQTYIRRLRLAFGTYRKVCKDKKYTGQRAKKILSNVHCHNLRWAFELWRKNNVLEVLAEEQNTTGPITEEVFEANRTIKNLKDFMRDQHFTEEELVAYTKAVFDNSTGQMHWLVKRLQQPKENKVMQRCFDHWVFWLKVKRVMRYHLRFCNNQVVPVKCDIRWAFDKWKSGDINNSTQLNKMDYNRLQLKNIDQSKGLDKLAESEANNSAIINNLNTQRDELLTHYVRAQKLALGLLQDNHRRSRGLAFDIWKQHSKHSRKADGTAFVNDSVVNITGIKSKINELEATNHQLAQENHELRQFSMDGFKIAQNVKALHEEREHLSVDLADKASVVKKLLDENKRMKEQLAAMGIHDAVDLATKDEVAKIGLNQGVQIR